MANNDSFSMSIKQENTTVPPPAPPRETPTGTPPPREANLADDKNQSLLNLLRSTSLTPQETETCLGSLANVMTSSEDSDDALFQEVISKLSGIELQRMAALLTSKADDRYFLEMARNKNGSIRLQTLLGKSDDADIFFVAAILRNFFHVMTDQHASYVATQGMRVFGIKKKFAMRDQIISHAALLACDQYGSIALNAIIRDVAFLYCSTGLFDAVASNALLLSNDAYGNIVVLQGNLSNLWTTPPNRRFSWQINKLLKLSPLIYQWIKKRVCNGVTCRFWTDNWSSLGMMRQFLQLGSSTSLGIPEFATLASLHTNDGWQLPP